MKRLLVVLLTLVVGVVQAQFVDGIHSTGKMYDIQKDFGLVDDGAKENQMTVVQSAIDKVSEAGGGCLYIPKGTYMFSEVWMKSNVHILVEEGTRFKLFWPLNSTVNLFHFDAEKDHEYVENVSIRGKGGRYIVEYPQRLFLKQNGIRFVDVGQVKNFMISDATVYDNHTMYVAIAVGLSKLQDSNAEPRFRPTHGVIRNITIYDSAEGYGLTQLHRADNLLFENLYAKGGGVTFRLETGGGGAHAGIFEIDARNIICENEKRAVMMGPHTAQNGVVRIDGVLAISCGMAVTIGDGFIDSKNTARGDALKGRFGEGSYVKNVRVIYGEDAIVGVKGIQNYPVEGLKHLRIPESQDMHSFRGPSRGGVRSAATHFTVNIENVTLEGFPDWVLDYPMQDGVNSSKKADEVLKDVPCYELVKELYKNKQNRDYKMNQAILDKYFKR